MVNCLSVLLITDYLLMSFNIICIDILHEMPKYHEIIAIKAYF